MLFQLFLMNYQLMFIAMHMKIYIEKLHQIQPYKEIMLIEKVIMF